MSKSTIVGILAIMSLVGSALGEIVEVRLEGIVTDANLGPGFAFDGSVEIGAAMTGFCRYDSLAGDRQIFDDTWGLYDMFEFSLSVGNYTFMNDPAGAGPLFSVSVNTWGYGVGAWADEPVCDGTVFYNGVPLQFDEVEWTGRFRAWFALGGPGLEGATDALPGAETFPPLSFFTKSRGLCIEVDEDLHYGIYGEITSLVVVPEPGTVVLLGLGAVAALRRRKVHHEGREDLRR